MGVGAAVVSADWVALLSLWEVPTFPSPPAEMVAQMLKRVAKWMWRPERGSSCGGLWWHGKWCYGRGCVDRRIEGAVPAVSPIEDVARLDPVGRHSDRSPAHE
jgi:hypothetical protein